MTKEPSASQRWIDDDARCPTDPASAAAWRRKRGLKPPYAVAEAVPTRSPWYEAIMAESPD
jgi:hypothetical protein